MSATPTAAACLAAVRAVYSLATIAIFCELVFRWRVERAALRRLPGVEAQAWLASRPRSAMLATALAAALLSSVFWFLAQTQVMSGVPLEALSWDTLGGALPALVFILFNARRDASPCLLCGHTSNDHSH